MASLIQVKRSTTTAIPGSLQPGELAYTSNGELLFIGSVVGTDTANVIAIGGKRTPGVLTANQALVANADSWIDQLNTTKLILGGVGETINVTSISTDSTISGANNSNNVLMTAWAVKDYVDNNSAANLGGLDDVSLSSTANNELLVYNATSGKWENATISGTANEVDVSFSGQDITISLPDAVTIVDLTVSNTFSISGAANFADSATVTSSLTVNGNTALSNNISLGANSSHKISFLGQVNTSIIPDANNTYDLGSTTLRWKDLYLSGNTLVLGNTTLSDSANGLVISGDIAAANLSASGSVSLGGATSLGSTLTVTGNATFSNTVTIAGATTINNTLASGNTSVTGTLSVTGGANVATLGVAGATALANSLSTTGAVTFANTLAVTGATTLSNTVAVTGAATFSNTIAVTGVATFSANASVQGSLAVSGDATVSGNLIVNGTLTTIDTDNVIVEDSIIQLARNNAADTLDIGLYGKYVDNAVTKYTGLFRDATDGKYKLFSGLTVDPTTTVDTSNQSFTLATLKVNLESPNVDISGGTIANVNFSSANVSITGGSISGITDIAVADGGTGVSAFTENGIFYGGTTSSLSFATGTSGQILQINNSGVPVFGGIDGGTF
jgi:hypothetical protein